MIGWFPSKSVKVSRKIGWSSIPSKSVQVLWWTLIKVFFDRLHYQSLRQKLWPSFLVQENFDSVNGTLDYWKYTVFRSFLLQSLTYWAEILHMTLFLYTTEQVRVLSLCVNFWRSNAICELRISALFCMSLLWLCFNVLQIKFKGCHSASVWLVQVLSPCIRLVLRLSISFQHLPPICIYNWAEILNLTLFFLWVSFFFFFRKVLYINSLLKCSWRAYYALFEVLRYILIITTFWL